VAELDRRMPFEKKIALAGLDPASDFCHGYWARIDFRNSRLAGFDFSGADLSGCRFEGAYIAGACFDLAILARDGGVPAGLTAAADYDDFVRTWKASRRAPVDLTHLPLGAVYFVAPGVTRTRGEETFPAHVDDLRQVPKAGHTGIV